MPPFEAAKKLGDARIRGGEFEKEILPVASSRDHATRRDVMQMKEVVGEDLVTGGSGFIGSVLCDYLSSLGMSVTAFDRGRLPSGPAGVKRKVGDINALFDVVEVVKGKSRVFHLAGVRNVSNSESPSTDYFVNVGGTVNVLEAMRRYNDSAELLYVSSSSVYGEPRVKLVSEEVEPRPVTLYGASKLAAELHCDVYTRKYGMKIVKIRPFNTYGTTQGNDLVPATIQRVLRGLPPLINGSGKQSRDFMYVDDLVRIMNLVLSHGKAYGKSINVGRGKSVTVLETVELISKTFGQGKILPPIFTGHSGGSRGNTCDAKLLGSILGMVPTTDLRAGLQMMKGERDWLAEKS